MGSECSQCRQGSRSIQCLTCSDLFFSPFSLGSHLSGVLLKTDTVEESDQKDLGVLMALLMLGVFLSAIGTALLEMYTARHWLKTVSHAFKIHYVGKVQAVQGVPCISSFPGKFEDSGARSWL